jgi:hypothetical protein
VDRCLPLHLGGDKIWAAPAVGVPLGNADLVLNCLAESSGVLRRRSAVPVWNSRLRAVDRQRLASQDRHHQVRSDCESLGSRSCERDP